MGRKRSFLVLLFPRQGDKIEVIGMSAGRFKPDHI
jgi:hypothetical protein